MADAYISHALRTLRGRGQRDGSLHGKQHWPGLPQYTAASPVRTTDAELRRRFLCRQAQEAARCFAEGVITDAREADLGAIPGWGFSTWTGSPFNMAGVRAFGEECDRLTHTRFEASRKLPGWAENDRSFYGVVTAASSVITAQEA